jgi:hypothetical protein
MMLALNTQPFHAPGLCPLALFGLAKLRCCLRPSLMEIYAVDAILWREAVGSRCVSAPEYAIAGLHRELAVERMEKDVLKKL